MANTYTYVDTTGSTKTVQANDPASALSSAPGIAPNSGVQLNTATPVAGKTGGYVGNVDAVPGTSTPQVAAAGTDAYGNPIAASGVRRYTGTGSITGQTPAEKAAADYYATGAGANRAVVDETAMRNAALAAVQSQIDATNATYADLTNREIQTGEQRKGATRAVNARSGTLGQDFGNAEISRAQETTDKNVQAIGNQRNLVIQQILGKAASDADAKIANEKATVDKNNKEYQAFLQSSAENTTNQIKQFAAAGGKIEQLTDAEYNHFLESTGLTPEQMKNLVVLNQPKQDIIHSEVQGSKYVQVTQDPVTKKITTNTIDMGFQVPQGYKTEKVANGQVIFYPDKIDPTKPFKDQIYTYGVPTGTGAGGAKTYTDGGFKYSQADVAQGNQILNEHRGTDGYVDPYVYQQMYNAWVNPGNGQAGGTPQGFAKLYPPDKNVNPASNAMFPAYLQNKSKAATPGRAG